MEETEALWSAIQEASRQALIWLKGPPGSGKSFIMARLACNLLDEARQPSRAEPALLILPYRFRADQDSCRPAAFLRFMRERLSEGYGAAAELRSAAWTTASPLPSYSD